MKLEDIRKKRLSEVDYILDLFQGSLSLSEILNQDYSLISDLANIRRDKIEQSQNESTPVNPPGDGDYVKKLAELSRKE